MPPQATADLGRFEVEGCLGRQAVIAEGQSMSIAGPPTPRRRWLQFSLWGLMVLRLTFRNQA